MCRVIDHWFGSRDCTSTVVAVIGLSLPVAMIVMGAIHLDNCPAERYIPIYLIVSGCFSIVLAVYRLTWIGTWVQENEGKTPKAIYIPSIVIGLFLFVWLIAGTVWIDRIYNNYDPDNVLSPNYCDTTFYSFAFFMMAVGYIVSLLVCFIAIMNCVIVIIGAHRSAKSSVGVSTAVNP